MFGRKAPTTAFKVRTVQEYFDRLEERFVPSAAQKMDSVFQWVIQGDESMTYHAFLKNGTMDLQEGEHSSPDASITIKSSDFLQIINGETEGKRLFLTGRAKVSGSVKFAMKFKGIFPPAG